MFKKITNQNISRVLFSLFLLFLPWQTRFFLLPNQIEYLSFSIYLSEIILWLAFGFWLIEDYKKVKIFGIFLLFLIFAGISIYWAEYKVIAYRLVLYIFEGVLIFAYIKRHQKDIGSFIRFFLLSLAVVSGFAIFQFFNLGSESFKWLGLAERGAWNLGDIVVSAENGRFLRAYGPFPHPNILGGYLAVGILLLFYLIKNNSIKPFFSYILYALFFFALIISFSRASWLALVIAGAYFLFKNLNNRTVKNFLIFSIALIFIFVYIFFPFINTRIKSNGWLENRSHSERLASWKSGLWVGKENLVSGTGAGNYMAELRNQLKDLKYKNPNNINIFQPTHNILLLVLAELGIFGLLIYLFFWRKLWKIRVARAAVILFFIIGFFDHYIWSLYSGQMLFWVGIGLISQEN